MLTAVELEYVKSLISTYYLKGYKYYLCTTVTEYGTSNTDYDLCIYFSKEPIEAITDNYFEVKNGIQIYIDSSSKRDL